MPSEETASPDSMLKSLNRYLDHAVLKPEMTRQEAEDAINLGLHFNTRTVCVRPCDVELAKSLCGGTRTDVCAVLAFPHGCGLSITKIQEAEMYVELGVAEVDMVSNYGLIRGGDWQAFEKDVACVFQILHENGILLKVILETSTLNPNQIEQATQICAEIGVDYVKTSTGFNGSGATIEAVEIMLKAAGGRTKVKASGGIRDADQATGFIEMGCDRLGVGFSTTPVLCGESAPSKDSGY